MKPPKTTVSQPYSCSENKRPLQTKTIRSRCEMKFLSNKELNQIGKGVLAAVLASTVTLSASMASAAENQEENVESSQTVEIDTGSDHMTVKEENSAEIENETVKPTLVPGEFFYFAKMLIEKIQLALTFDEQKEAKLLAEFASERLAEAEVLFADGKETEAIEVINKALENLTQAEKQEESVIEEQEDDKEESIEEDPQVEDEVVIEDDVAVEDEVIEDSENELEELISHNIIALQAALEKVKNPIARAAIEKNIEKSYAKLARKIEKINKKYAVENEETVIEESPSDNELTVDSNTDTTANLETVKTETTKQVKLNKDKVNQQLHEEKTKAAEQRAEAKKAHEYVKQENKKAKVEVKEEIELNKETTKRVEKKGREEDKQERINKGENQAQGASQNHPAHKQNGSAGNGKNNE